MFSKPSRAKSAPVFFVDPATGDVIELDIATATFKKGGQVKKNPKHGTCRPKTITRDVDIRYVEGELFVERADESITIALTVEEALATIKKDDAAISKRRKAMVITRLTWHDLPQYLSTKVKS